MRKLIAAVGFATALVVTASPAIAANSPVVVVSQLVVDGSSVSITWSVNRGTQQVASLRCRVGATVVNCGTPSGDKRATAWTLSVNDVPAGTVAFTVDVVLTDGGRATASRSGSVTAPSKLTASCVVTPYLGSYTADPYIAGARCTNADGDVLPASYLDLSHTVHTNAGSYEDEWSFADPNGVYASASGQVVDVIEPASQLIVWGPYPGSPFVLAPSDNTFTPKATATSGQPVTFAVTGNCVYADGEVTFTDAGACTVTAYQSGDNNWSPTDAQLEFALQLP